MPSLFEPGGIVQHEFFLGGTPVIAFKTGGLKDSVFEFLWHSDEGNGFTFESHNAGDLIQACERAIGTFQNKAKYEVLRKNAEASVMDGAVVSRAWLSEFNRLKGKVFVDDKLIKENLAALDKWVPEQYRTITNFEDLFGKHELNKQNSVDFKLEDIDLGADDDRQEESKVELSRKQSKTNARVPQVFKMYQRGPRYNKVELVGSFDNW